MTTSVLDYNEWRKYLGQHAPSKRGRFHEIPVAAIRDNTITILNLKRGGFRDGDGMLYALSEQLEGNKSLTNLQLDGNDIGTHGCQELGKLLQKSSSTLPLTILSLQSNHIGTKTKQIEGKSSNDTEQVRDSSGFTQLCIGISKSKHIQRLDLQNNIFDDNCALLLGDAMKKNNTLLYVYIQNKKNNGLITDVGAVALARGLCVNSSILELNMYGNKSISSNCSDDFIDAISKHNQLNVLTIHTRIDIRLFKDKNINSISLENAGHGDLAIKIILSLLPDSSITSLDLSNNKFTHVLLPELASSTQRQGIKLNIANLSDISGENLREHRAWALIHQQQTHASWYRVLSITGFVLLSFFLSPIILSVLFPFIVFLCIFFGFDSNPHLLLSSFSEWKNRAINDTSKANKLRPYIIIILLLLFTGIYIWYPVVVVVLHSHVNFHEYSSIVYVAPLLLSVMITFTILLKNALHVQSLVVAQSLGPHIVFPLKIGNLLSIVSVFIEFFQLLALAVSPDAFQIDFSMLKFMFIDICDGNKECVLSGVVVTIFSCLLWFGIVGVLLHNTFVKDFSTIAQLPGAQALIELLSDTFFLWIVKNLLDWLQCSYSNTKDIFILDNAPSIECWSGYHLYIAIVFFFFIPLYIYSCNTIGVYFLEDFGGLEIKFSEVSTMILRYVKLCVMLATFFFSDIPSISFGIQFVVYTYATYLFIKQDGLCSIFVVQSIKVVVLVVCCWSSLCSCIALLLNKSNESWVTSYLLIGGLLIILLVFFILYFKTEKEKRRLFHVNASFSLWFFISGLPCMNKGDKSMTYMAADVEDDGDIENQLELVERKQTTTTDDNKNDNTIIRAKTTENKTAIKNENSKLTTPLEESRKSISKTKTSHTKSVSKSKNAWKKAKTAREVTSKFSQISKNSASKKK